jgi:hypothetical protein
MHTSSYDILFTDCLMPGMNALAVPAPSTHLDPQRQLFHVPLCAADATRSRGNIALWNSYLLPACVRSMVRMGWDYTT